MMPCMSTIPVTTFSLKGTIVLLLTNKDLMQPQHLILDLSNPFKTFERSDVLNDIDTGWWYHETIDDLCQLEKDILLPLIIFIDGSNIDNNGRLSVEPVTITQE